MMKFNSHRTWSPGHTLFVMPSTYTLDTPWAFKKVLEGGRDVGSNLRGRDPNTPDGREEPAEVQSSGYAGEEACTVAWCPLASLSWLWAEGQEMENNSCPHSGRGGESPEAWALWCSPRLIVPVIWGHFIPLKITMNFGLRRNGIICHLNVWCAVGKIWKEFEIFLTILNMNNWRFSTASDQINDVTILFIIQPTVSKHLAFMIFHSESSNDLHKTNCIWWEIFSRV